MHIGFRLKLGRDDLIINWLESVGKNDRSYYIKEALRNYLSGIVPQNCSPAHTNLASNITKENGVDDKERGDVNRIDTKNPDKEDTDLEANLNSWIGTV